MRDVVQSDHQKSIQEISAEAEIAVGSFQWVWKVQKNLAQKWDSSAWQCTCTLVVGGQGVPRQHNVMTPEHHLPQSPLSMPDISSFPKWTAIRECRGSQCENSESIERRYSKNGLQDCFQNVYKRWKKRVTAQKELL
jgi:hypothetical protein